MLQPSPYLRTPGAAKYTGVSESTLEKLRLSGGGPPYSKLGRIVVYAVADLNEWIASGVRRNTSAAA